MWSNVRALVAGVLLAAVGLVLYLATPGVQTPVVRLTSVGVVLMVLGAAEILGVLLWMAWPARSGRR